MRLPAALVLAAGTLAMTMCAQADDMIVAKKVFELPELTTVAGRTIRGIRVGWESYGTLDQDKSNAILVNHFFSGTSHAAGKYAAADAAPGYWDAIIGPGKAIDTNKYFVFSSDTLVNLNTGDPHVVTTGPASVDPATGKPYGMTFPLVTIGDFVRVEKALVDSLGIKKLHAVVGPSMGGLQTYDWAASYPDMVERIMPVISAAEPNPWLIEWLSLWAAPILLDPKWNNGDYGRDPPLQGLAAALKLVSLQASQHTWPQQAMGAAFADSRDPLAVFDAKFKIEAAMDAAGAARAAVADANHFLYMVKANQTFVPGSAAGIRSAAEGIARIRARALILYSAADLVFPAAGVKATAAAIAANGTSVETGEIEGPLGHLNGVALMAPLGPRIADFLAR